MTGEFILGAFALAFYVVAYRLGISIGKERAESPTKTVETLNPDDDYTEVLTEGPDGYGLGLREFGTGVELVEFDNDGEIYNDVTIQNDELTTVANELSVRACEHEAGA